MRIRSIKPEFWTHPVMARQNDATKLLAIGLLNFADDEGYFYAEEQLIRSALRPFDDDSTIVRASLAALCAIEFCEVVFHPTHGKIGRVISFEKHQRVDRPKPSIIKALHHSSNVRRMFVDQSSLEGIREQGAGNRESVPPKSPPPGGGECGELPLDVPPSVNGTNGTHAPEPKAEAKPKAKRKRTASDDPMIEAIYQAYPLKAARPKALEAIRKAINTLEPGESPEWLLSQTTKYAAIRGDRPYTPHPATWFNAQRYRDDSKTWANNEPTVTTPRRESDKHLIRDGETPIYF